MQPPILAADVIAVGKVAVGVRSGGQPDVTVVLFVGGHKGGGELVRLETR